MMALVYLRFCPIAPARRSFEDGGSYLKADYSIDCNGDDRGFMVAWATLSIAVYALGIPALYAFMLFRQRSILNPPGLLPHEAAALRVGHPDVQDTLLLWGSYDPGFFVRLMWRSVSVGATLAKEG